MADPKQKQEIARLQQLLLSTWSEPAIRRSRVFAAGSSVSLKQSSGAWHLRDQAPRLASVVAARLNLLNGNHPKLRPSDLFLKSPLLPYLKPPHKTRVSDFMAALFELSAQFGVSG
jgi:hypothetical protein